MKNTNRAPSQILLICLCFIWSAAPALSAVRADRESAYSEALLAYHSKKYDEALQLLSPWVSTAQPPIKFLELVALTQKDKGNLDAAYETYRKLYERVSKRGKISEESAAYVFEMGMVKFHKKDYVGARRHLLALKNTEFNSDATFFVLGTMDYQDKQYASAETALVRVAEDERSALQSAANLYLGNLYAETGYTRAAIRNFRNARRLAVRSVEEGKADSLTTQVSTASAKSLLALARSRTYGSVGVLGGYDSNVFLIPTTLVSSSGSGLATLKSTVLGNVGYESSLIRKWQFGADYRTSFNYNTNATTQSGQYFANDLSLTATKDPVEVTSIGVKLNTVAVMRAGSSGLAMLAVTPFLGPVLTHEFSPSLVARVEVLGYYQSYTEEAGTSSDFFKTGLGGRAKFTIASQDPSTAWNPTASLSFDIAQTEGTEFRSKTATFEISNAFDLSKSMRLIPALSAGYVTYADRASGARADLPVTAAATVLYELRSAWALLASASFTSNQSNITDLYQYTRIQSSLGLTYAF